MIMDDKKDLPKRKDMRLKNYDYSSPGAYFTQEVAYKCYCSRQRVESALISLGKAELEEIRQEGKTFPVECQFCDTVYEFTPADLKEILEKI